MDDFKEQKSMQQRDVKRSSNAKKMVSRRMMMMMMNDDKQQQQQQQQYEAVIIVPIDFHEVDANSSDSDHNNNNNNRNNHNCNMTAATDLEEPLRPIPRQSAEGHHDEAVEGDSLLSWLDHRGALLSDNRNNDGNNDATRSARNRLLLIVTSASAIFVLLTWLVPWQSWLASVPSVDDSSKTYTAYDIYCTGPILHAVQMMNLEQPLFHDSKDFVDRPMKADPNEVMKAFLALPLSSSSSSSSSMMNDKNGTIPTTSSTITTNDTAILSDFLETYFDPPGSDLVQVVPSDFQERPAHFNHSIPHNETLRQWAWEIHAVWQVLGRKPQMMEENPDRHSFLPTQHLLVVPGGRFRESYYWDTYWIVHGLLASRMYDTTVGVVQNLLDFVNAYGFVPNGGRIYYLTRSQPPLLSDMVRILYEYKKNQSTSLKGDEDGDRECNDEDSMDDLDFLESATQTLDREYEFWMQPGQHAVTIHKEGQAYTLNRYVSQATDPRPESYREDLHTAQKATDSHQNIIYSEIIAACESGWDFSSRWFQNPQELETATTSHVIPVDLNVFLYRMETNLHQFHVILQHVQQAEFYRQAAARRKQAIQAVLWDESSYMWRDYRIDINEWSPVLSASNYFPLWTENLVNASNTTLLQQIQKSFEHSELVQPGGVLTTTQYSGQQWDKPNAWPPIQDILVEGFMQYNVTRELGQRLLQKWVHTNWISTLNGHHVMLEKYNALHPGTTGHGGEYAPQTGFGWTNGVVLKWLTTHASLLNDLH